MRRPLQYVAGRDIGEEYQYIIDRQYAEKFPGNMLERPSLLLNPWALRSTESSTQQAAKGDEFGRTSEPSASRAARQGGKTGRDAGRADFSNLDFLKHSSIVLANLAPDKKGRVKG